MISPIDSQRFCIHMQGVTAVKKISNSDTKLVCQNCNGLVYTLILYLTSMDVICGILNYTLLSRLRVRTNNYLYSAEVLTVFHWLMKGFSSEHFKIVCNTVTSCDLKLIWVMRILSYYIHIVLYKAWNILIDVPTWMVSLRNSKLPILDCSLKDWEEVLFKWNL